MVCSIYYRREMFLQKEPSFAPITYTRERGLVGGGGNSATRPSFEAGVWSLYAMRLARTVSWLSGGEGQKKFGYRQHEEREQLALRLD